MRGKLEIFGAGVLEAGCGEATLSPYCSFNRLQVDIVYKDEQFRLFRYTVFIRILNYH